MQPETAVDCAAVEAIEREPLAQGFDRLQLIAEGIEIGGLDILEDSLQVLADLPRDCVPALVERPGAAAVFRRSRPPSTDTDRVRSLRLRGEPAFDPDLVLPGVVEVILVDEPLVGSEPEVIEPDGVGIVGERESPHPADAIVAAVDAEPVEMEVTPAEGDLEHVMEFGEGAVAADQ
jgi:hypothetical protein